MKITAAAGTNVGRIRNNNEDNFYINGFYKKDVNQDNCVYADDNNHESYTYAVCDGVGGVALGEIASLLSIERLMEYDVPGLTQRIGEYVEAANADVCNSIKENGGKRMGSTLAMLAIENDKATICNLGDSRIYLIRDGEMEQLSHDHTRLQRMIDAGIISKSDDTLLKKDHVLTQFLGVFPEEFILNPHLNRDIELQDKDIFLLCSDGLTDMVEEEELKNMINDLSDHKPGEVVDQLICKALEGGGKDNVTVVIVKADQED